MSVLEERRKLALAAYWGARSHEGERAAVQRMIALGINENEYPACPEPECVALREAKTEAAGLATIAGAGYTTPHRWRGYGLTEMRSWCEGFVVKRPGVVPDDLADLPDVPLSERGFGT